MGLSRRRFTREFKLAAVQRLEQGIAIAEVARAMEVNPNVLHRWRKEFRQGPGNAFRGQGQRRWSEGRIAELERKIGQQTLEIDFLKGLCLAKILSSSEINSLHMFSSAAVSAMTGAHVPLRGIRVGPAHPLLAIASKPAPGKSRSPATAGGAEAQASQTPDGRG
jgi:transposase